MSSVQYLRFTTERRVPVAAGVEMQGLEAETTLNENQRQALSEDLQL